MSDRRVEERDDMEQAAGREQTEPGQPTRSMDERGEFDSDAAREVEEIAEQQGSTQRGFAGDRQEGTDRAPEASSEEPPIGGRPEGDLPR